MTQYIISWRLFHVHFKRTCSAVVWCSVLKCQIGQANSFFSLLMLLITKKGIVICFSSFISTISLCFIYFEALDLKFWLQHVISSQIYMNLLSISWPWLFCSIALFTYPHIILITKTLENTLIIIKINLLPSPQLFFFKNILVLFINFLSFRMWTSTGQVLVEINLRYFSIL